MPLQELKAKVGEVAAFTEAVKKAAGSEAAGIAAARKEAAISIQKIQEDADAKVAAANDLLEQTKQDHAAKLAEMEENTQRSLQDAHKRAKNAAERARAEAERLEAAKIQEIEQIKNLAGSTVTEANKKAQREREEIEKKFAEALEAHEENINAERLRHAREIAELTEEMETKLKTAQEEAQAEVAILETKLQIAQEESRAEAAKFEAALQKAKDDNANAMAQIATYKSKIEELNEKERSLSSSSRNLQETILKLEEERASTLININNIEREIIAAYSDITSAAYAFVGDLARSGREWTRELARNGQDWTVSQSKHAWSSAMDVYSTVVRPSVTATAFGVAGSTKAMYASHIQPPMNELGANVQEKYKEMVKPHIDEHIMPIYESKVKPAFNEHVLPIFIDHVVPIYENHVIPAKDRAFDAAVAGRDVAIFLAEDMKQSAWKDIKEAMKLAEEASMEAYGYVTAFIKTSRSRAFEFSVHCSVQFFDASVGLIDKYDKNGIVPDVVKEKMGAARDNADTFVETAAWVMFVGLLVFSVPFLMKVAVLCVEVAFIIAFELATWPFRVVWFFCPLRLLLGRREEGIVPDVLEVSPTTSIDEGAQSLSPIVKETVNMRVRPITPPGESSKPYTRSRAAKKDTISNTSPTPPALTNE